MKHSDFKIGQFFFSNAGKWICTDIGTRTIVAVNYDRRMDPNGPIGPPYAEAESVFDEYDVEGCSLTIDDVVK